jgi:hypothetical protein
MRVTDLDNLILIETGNGGWVLGWSQFSPQK